jgi:hypothetical protein
MTSGMTHSFMLGIKLVPLLYYIDTSFWLKFLHNIDSSIDNNILVRYSTILADRFTTMEELLVVDETELINLGITNQFDRTCLMKQVRLLDDKVYISKD